MTPIDESFNDEMEHAARMRKVDVEAYWIGYAAGLMRARFGRVAVDDGQHDAWSHNGAPDDQARGYRDGCGKLAGRFALGSHSPLRDAD